MSIEAVTFDLDDTLLRYRQSPDAILRESFDRAGYEPFFTFLEYLDAFHEFVDEAGSSAEARDLAYAHLAREQGYDPSVGREVATAYAVEHDRAEVELYPGAADMLEACANRFDIALITNGPQERQAGKLAATGITDVFDASVYAADDLRLKPDPAPFEQALDLLDCPAARTIHIGDSWDADVRGALDVGMDAIWIGDDENERADPSVRRIDGIADLPTIAEFDGLSLS